MCARTTVNADVCNCACERENPFANSLAQLPGTRLSGFSTAPLIVRVHRQPESSGASEGRGALGGQEEC